MNTGIIGTIKWTLDKGGTLTLEPLNGVEGSFGLTTPKEKICGEEMKNTFSTKYIKTKGILHAEEEDLESLFEGFFKLKTADLSAFETSKITSLYRMFANCASLVDVNLSSFNTCKVSSMGGMFFACQKLKTADLSNFNTSMVFNMDSMFYGCSSLVNIDLSNFDTVRLCDMSNMFCKCSSLKTISLSHLDTHNVTTMAYMFAYCKELTTVDFNSFVANRVSNTFSMFYNCKNLRTLKMPRFYFNNNSDVMGMFSGCKKLTEIDLRGFENCANEKSKFASIPLGAHYIVSKEIEKRAKEAVPITAFYYLYDEEGDGIECILDKDIIEQRIKKIYTLLEKIAGLDFTKEKEILKKGITVENFHNPLGYKSLEFLHEGMYPSTKKMVDIVKIIKSRGYEMTLFSKSISNILELLKNDGTLSDINTFLSGVPLEDILA